MKRIFKILCLILTLSVLGSLYSCSDTVAYTMQSYKTGVMSYKIPSHFVKAEQADGGVHYTTVSAYVMAHSYTHDQFTDLFSDYYGTFEAIDIANFIVNRDEQSVSVTQGRTENSATYSFLYTDEQTQSDSYYYKNYIVDKYRKVKKKVYGDIRFYRIKLRRIKKQKTSRFNKDTHRGSQRTVTFFVLCFG